MREQLLALEEKYPGLVLCLTEDFHFRYGTRHQLKIFRDNCFLGSITSHDTIDEIFVKECLCAARLLGEKAPLYLEVVLSGENLELLVGGATTILHAEAFHTVCVAKNSHFAKVPPAVIFLARFGNFPQELEHAFNLSEVALPNRKTAGLSDKLGFFSDSEGMWGCTKLFTEQIFDIPLPEIHKTYGCPATELLWELLKAFLLEKDHQPADAKVLSLGMFFYSKLSQPQG